MAVLIWKIYMTSSFIILWEQPVKLSNYNIPPIPSVVWSLALLNTRWQFWFGKSIWPPLSLYFESRLWKFQNKTSIVWSLVMLDTSLQFWIGKKGWTSLLHMFLRQLSSDKTKKSTLRSVSVPWLSSSNNFLLVRFSHNQSTAGCWWKLLSDLKSISVSC